MNSSNIDALAETTSWLDCAQAEQIAQSDSDIVPLTQIAYRVPGIGDPWVCYSECLLSRTNTRPPQQTESFRSLVMLVGVTRSTTPRSSSYSSAYCYVTAVRELCVVTVVT